MELDMVDPEEVREGLPMPVRTLIILHGTAVKLSILQPATTGSNFNEVFCVLTSLWRTGSAGTDALSSLQSRSMMDRQVH